MFNRNKKDIRKLDLLLMLSVAALVVFGLIVLNSALNPINGSILSQLIATSIGFVLMFIIYFFEFDLFKKIKWLIYLVMIGFIVVVMFFGKGGESWGANLWLNIGPVSVQPSEFAKVLLIIFLAGFIEDNKKKVNSLGFLVSYFVLGLVPVALVIRQGDFGTAMVILFIVAVMFFMSGIRFKNLMTIIAIILALILLLGAVAFPYIWEERLDGYQRERILNFLDPSRDTMGTGIQMQRGYTAIGSGQLSGRGYMQGPMTQSRYIPEQHTDYIFPVLIEEFGFIGGLATILLYLIMILRMIRIALKANSVFHSSMVVGIVAMFFIHIFENIGMTMLLMPVTGIPLPFFSNGGTYQMINLFSIGLVLTIGAYREPLDF